MSTCQTCNATLIIEGLSPGQQIRCANCLTISRFGAVEKVATDQMAWRSLWLGLASVLFLCFTGIPAIYYGIRSLLRMRFLKPEPRDRAAAVVGTLLGGFFGIVISFVAIFGLIMFLAFYLTYHETTDPQQVAVDCQQLFEFVPPAGIVGEESQSILTTQKSFVFSDQPTQEQQDVRVVLIHLGTAFQANHERTLDMLKSKLIHGQSLGNEKQTAVLDWNLDGHPAEIKKWVYKKTLPVPKDADPDASPEMVETHMYVGTFQHNGEFAGLGVRVVPGQSALTESDIQAIFANTKIR